MPDMNLGTAEGRIVIDASQAKKGAKEASDAVKATTKEQDAAAGRLKQGASTAAKAYGVAVVGGFALAINAAKNFDQALANVAAAGGKQAEGQMDAIREKALQLGADTKYSALEAAGAMEALIKAGLSVDEVLNGAADAAVNLAAAESIDLTQAAEIAATAMTAFNLKAEEMPKIADKISQSASATKMDVNDFAMAMNQSGAVAKTVGLSFDDMALAITAMGKAGIIGSDAGTSLKTMLLNLQPTTEKQIGLMEDLGIVTEDGKNRFFDANGEIKSMTEIAGVLGGALKGMSKQQKLSTLETLFGSDAIRAAAIIADQGAKGMENLTAEMNDQLSVAEKAAVKNDTLEGSIEQLKGSVETAAIQFGTALIPVVRVIADLLTGLVNIFGALPQPVQVAIAGFLALSTAALGVGWAFLKIRNIVRDVRTVMGGSKLVATLMSGLGTAKTAIGVWYLTFVGFMKKAAIAAATGAKRIAVAFGTMIASAAKATASMIATAAVHVAQWIRMAVVAMARAAMIAAAWLLANPWALIAAAIIALVVLIIANWDKILEFLTMIWNWIKDLAITVWTAIKDFFVMIFTAIKDAVVWYFNLYKTVIMTVFNAIKNFFITIWNAIKNFLVGLWNGIKNVATTVWNAIKNFFTTVLNSIGNFFKNTWNGLLSFLGRIWNSIKNAVVSAWNGIVNFIGGIPGKILSALGDLGNLLVDIGGALIEGLWEGISGMLDWLWDNITGVAEDIGNWFARQLDIFSPSRVFAEFGKYTIEGYVVGIDATKKQAIKAVEEVALRVMDAGTLDSLNLTPNIGAAGTTTTNVVNNRGGPDEPGEPPMVNVNMTINNPLPEKPSVSASKRVGRAAKYGAELVLNGAA